MRRTSAPEARHLTASRDVPGGRCALPRSGGLAKLQVATISRRVYASPVRMASCFEPLCPPDHHRCASSAVRAARAGVVPAAFFQPSLAGMPLPFS